MAKLEKIYEPILGKGDVQIFEILPRSSFILKFAGPDRTTYVNSAENDLTTQRGKLDERPKNGGKLMGFKLASFSDRSLIPNEASQIYEVFQALNENESRPDPFQDQDLSHEKLSSDHA